MLLGLGIGAAVMVATPIVVSVTGTAGGLEVVATTTQPSSPSIAGLLRATPGKPVSLPSHIPVADVEGRIHGDPFTLRISIDFPSQPVAASAPGYSSLSTTVDNGSGSFGRATGTFTGDPVDVALTTDLQKEQVHFDGTVGGPHVVGTVESVVDTGASATARASFTVGG